jgi:HSP20 family protein
VRRNSDDDERPFDDATDNRDQPPLADGGVDAVDVHEYQDTVTVVADIPDSSEDAVDIQCDGRTLAIRAETTARPVVLQVDLPTYVDSGSAETTYNNGVLEVALDQDYDPANIGFQ